MNVVCFECGKKEVVATFQEDYGDIFLCKEHYLKAHEDAKKDDEEHDEDEDNEDEETEDPTYY